MYLPSDPLYCIQTLERAGFSAYAVGGCVRDSLLGLCPQDYDLCTDATPEQISRVFSIFRQVHSGEKHGTVGIVIDRDVYEITTFRTEGGYRDNRHPDWVRFVTRIEEDLARRDFTINAMAYAPSVGYIDPWGGRQDLEDKILRAVGDPRVRFTEDALRILRGVRFAVRYGLQVDPDTEQAMISLAPLLKNLAKERIFDELCKLLPLVSAQDLIRFAPVLTQVIPALAPCVGFDQRNPHHAYDVFTHTAHVVQAAPPEPALRWAALLHDVAKPAVFSLDEQGVGHFLGHAQESARMADAILRELKAPTALREQVVFLIDRHMLPILPERPLLLRRMNQFGTKNLLQLLQLQEADFTCKGTQSATDPEFEKARQMIYTLLQEQACVKISDLAVSGRDLLALGIAAGPVLGQTLQQLLELVQQEQLPNEKEPLLQKAKELTLQ